MGWCSGTIIFDTVCEAILDDSKFTHEKQKEVIGVLYDALRDQDWDCQWDSEYLKHNVVKEVMVERDDWYEEEDED